MGTVNLFNIGTQALINVQAQIQTVSQNISNSQNPDFNKRTALTQNVNNVSTQVTVQRTIDFSLQGQALDATAAVGGSDESNRLFQSVASLVGTDNTGTGRLQTKLQTFAAAWSAYESAPQDGAVETSVVQAGDDFASEVRNQFTQLNTLQAQEQATVQTDVTLLNTALTQLGQINIAA